MTEIIIKDNTKKKYDSFHSFNLLNRIKINKSDKIKNSIKKKKKVFHSMIELKTLKEV